MSNLLISCKSLQKKQAFEMTSPRERHLADREWAGVADPFEMTPPRERHQTDREAAGVADPKILEKK
jgi:hypothetical protein